MPPRIVVMGVSGCGKSTLAEALSKRLGFSMIEGDALHPAENIAAMQSGRPLTDEMRGPWLAAIAAAMEKALQTGPGAVASCSALKRSYRDILSQHGPVAFVHLDLPLAAARHRMADRPGHFMNAALAESQAATLEPLAPGETGIALDAMLGPELLTDAAAGWLQQHD
ncbi:gluconokinase (plasmid) [Paracoccus albus]|nr:gluconokinase [Paracoccus albus]WBU62069.1 gluconokinase [Paracoccus albus]